MQVARRILMIAIGLYLSLFSAIVAADSPPTFSVIRHISIGNISFAVGGCQINANTGVVTSIPPSTNCIATGTGMTGRYMILTGPNKQVNFRINQKAAGGDGFVFIPNGKLVSNIETVNFSANTTVQVNSGPTGFVDVFVGGQFFINTQLAPSTTYNFDVANAIEWSVAP